MITMETQEKTTKNKKATDLMGRRVGSCAEKREKWSSSASTSRSSPFSESLENGKVDGLCLQDVAEWRGAASQPITACDSHEPGTSCCNGNSARGGAIKAFARAAANRLKSLRLGRAPKSARATAETRRAKRMASDMIFFEHRQSRTTPPRSEASKWPHCTRRTEHRHGQSSLVHGCCPCTGQGRPHWSHIGWPTASMSGEEHEMYDDDE